MTDNSGCAKRDISRWFEQRTGQRLSESRLWRVETTLGPVMRQFGIPSLLALRPLLLNDHDAALSGAALHALLNHESSFFRDPQVFRMMEQEILPFLRSTLPERRLRILSVGCSTGQEAYSIAMILKNQEALWDRWRISITATDVSSTAVEVAKTGVYQQMEVQRGMAIGDLLRWFVPDGDRWRICDDIRSMVTFRTDNILQPKAIGGLYDLILCRNVLLYFAPELRERALRALHDLSASHSLLVLGAGETTVGSASDFAPSTEVKGAYARSCTRSAPAMEQALAS